MASRRSRLKAVANLPVRRKPLSVQQEVEGSNLGVENVSESVRETGEKNQEIGLHEDTSNAEKLHSIENSATGISSNCVESPVIQKVVAPVEEEIEKDSNVEVPPNESVCKPNETNKSLPTPAPRFGRRVKPSVSLAVLKDRSQRGESQAEVNTKESEPPAVQENCVTAQDINNSSFLSNDFNTSVRTEKTGEGSAAENLLEGVQNDPTVHLSERLENIPTLNTSLGKSDSEQCHLTRLGDSTQKNTDITLKLNSKSSVNSTKQSVCVNGLNSSGKTTSDLTFKQRNEVLSQGSTTLPEHPLNQSASQNSVHLQFSPNDNRRTVSWIKQKKPKFNDFARKVADARREFQRKYEKIPPDRSSLRMIDLIFYNPSTNPMESKSKFEKKENHMNDQDLLNESKVDDPDPVEKNSDSSPDDEIKDDFGKMPVPQVKIGLNGEIILDEKSLVIETTDAKKGREDLQNSVPVFEDRASKTCYYKRKTQKSRDWSDLETKRFYKALNTIGTDFSLMQKYFPVRTRLELKNKFKREEKLNRNLIDKALNNPSEFDITQFEKYLAMEKQVQEEENDRRLQRKIRPKRPENKIRLKSSVLAREITESDEEATESCHTASQDIQARMKLQDKSKTANEINLLCEKYLIKGTDGNQYGAKEHSSQPIVLEVVDETNGFNSTSKVFTNLNITESNRTPKIRDAFDEIQNVSHVNGTDENRENGNMAECSDLVSVSGGGTDVVDEFYQAVVNLSASLKSEAVKNPKAANKVDKKVKPLTRGEKRKAPMQAGRKQTSKKIKEHPYMSTLDIETYDSKYDSNSSSNESNDNSFTSTKTITDQDFIKLLAANAQNMKESKIQFQITENCSLEKNVEIILDNVPSITLSEI